VWRWSSFCCACCTCLQAAGACLPSPAPQHGVYSHACASVCPPPPAGLRQLEAAPKDADMHQKIVGAFFPASATPLPPPPPCCRPPACCAGVLPRQQRARLDTPHALHRQRQQQQLPAPPALPRGRGAAGRRCRRLVATVQSLAGRGGAARCCIKAAGRHTHAHICACGMWQRAILGQTSKIYTQRPRWRCSRGRLDKSVPGPAAAAREGGGEHKPVRVTCRTLRCLRPLPCCQWCRRAGQLVAAELSRETASAGKHRGHHHRNYLTSSNL
jgi:hypothetical protein